MARTVRDALLDSRTARSRLKARGKPYFRSLEPGLHLGYRKPLSGPGKWVARHYVGDQTYELETLAIADDYSDPDGVAVLSFHQAQGFTAQSLMEITVIGWSERDDVPRIYMLNSERQMYRNQN